MKRLLSIFLATAMLISLIPAVFAADTDTTAGIKVVYDFTDEETFKKCEEYTDTKNNRTGVQINPTLFTYTTSKGFWEYAANSQNCNPLQSVNGTGVRIHPDTNSFQVVGGVGDGKFWAAFKIYIPKTATYNIEAVLNYANTSSNIYVNAFIFEVESVASAAGKINDKIVVGMTEQNKVRTDNFPKTSEANSTKTLPFNGEINLKEGEHYFVFNPTSTTTSNASYMRLLSLTLTENGTGTEFVPMISSIEKTEENGITTVKAKAELMSDSVTSAEDAVITYSVAEDDVSLASVDANTGVVEGLADGTATIIATATKNGQSSSKSIEVAVTAPPAEPEEDEELSDAFEVTEKTEENYTEPNVITVSVNNADISSAKNSDGTHTITAPETNGEGKKFLYWAKGLSAQKKIISFSNELSDYIPDAKYANYLIAVYEGEESQLAEYYNANGQLVGTKTEPSLPSMAGFGEAKGWEKYGETNIHVAQYELAAPLKNISVTVNNGTGTGTYAYGDTVTCTANGSGRFKCWTKSGINGDTEIISCDKNYTFKAWEECTVTAVYEEYNYKGNTAKIIIDSFAVGSETGVMAEFIGFGNNVVEKGIMWGDAAIAMTKPGNQFSVIADKPGTYKGYVIVKNSDGSFKKIIDGSFTK